MAFPTVSSKGTTYNTGGTNTDPFVIDLPDSLVNGNIILAFLCCDGNQSSTWPGGWTRIVDADSPSSAHLEVAYHIVDGTEGATISVDPGATAENAVCFTWQIQSWHGTTPPEAATAAGVSTTPDCPSLSPSWGSADTLWIACYSQNGGIGTVTYIAAYTANREQLETGGGGAVGGVISSLESAVATENPGAYGDTDNQNWAAATIAVRPAAGTQTPKSVEGAITPTGALLAQAGKVLSGAITPAGALTKQASKILSGAITPAGALAKEAAKVLAGGITPSGVLTSVKTFVSSVAGAITPSGALLAQAQKILTGGITPSGALAKEAGKVLAGGITPSGALTKQAGKVLAVGITPTGALATSKLQFTSLAGGITPSGVLSTLFIAGGAPAAAGKRPWIQPFLAGNIRRVGL